MKLSCRCGQVQGEIAPHRAYARATCYCRDCRAYARWLGGEGLMDAAGGADIVPMAPDGLRFTRGAEHLACMSLSPRGLLRWYAACCRTPLGNTPNDPKLFYLGVPVQCIAEPEETVDAAFGPAHRIVLNTESATGPVKSTPLAFAVGGFHIFRHILAAKLRGRHNRTFFDDSGEPIRKPAVLDKAQREALTDG